MLHQRFALPVSVVLFAAWLALLCAGCSGRGSVALDSAAARQLKAGLPDISALRSAKTVIDNPADASLAFQASPGALPGGGAMQLDAALALQWAIYSFAPTTDPLTDVDITLDMLPANECYLARANFASGRWDIFGPFNGTGNQNLQLDGADFISPGGNAFVAVIADPVNVVSVQALLWHTLGNDAPIASIQADIEQGDSPLLVTLDASSSTDADGSIVKYEWDISGSGNFNIDTGTTPTTTANYVSPGVFNAAVRVTDDDGASTVASIQIRVTVGGNVPPIAVLEADVTEGDGEAGFEVNFTSSASEDLDGTIDLYEWDLDDDGTFELSSTTPDLQALTVDVPNEFHPRLKVTDNGGLQSNDNLQILSHGWVSVSLEEPVSATGKYNLGEVSKRPAVAYRNQAGDLTYGTTSTNFGTKAADWDLITIDTDIGGCVDLGLLGSRPAIAYRSATGTAVARNFRGSSTIAGNWMHLDIVQGVFPGEACVGLADAKPSVAFIPNTGGLEYASSSTATGDLAADWSRFTLDAEAIAASDLFLELVDGNPALAYLTDTALVYNRSTTPGGTLLSDWNKVIVPSPTLGLAPQLAMSLVDGFPACIFVDNSASMLTYCLSSTTLGTNPDDWVNIPLSSTPLHSKNIVLADLGTHPFAYCDFSADDFLLESSSVDGSAPADWASVPTPVNPPDNGSFVAMCAIDGKPALLYEGNSPGAVQYSIRF